MFKNQSMNGIDERVEHVLGIIVEGMKVAGLEVEPTLAEAGYYVKVAELVVDELTDEELEDTETVQATAGDIDEAVSKQLADGDLTLEDVADIEEDGILGDGEDDETGVDSEELDDLDDLADTTIKAAEDTFMKATYELEKVASLGTYVSNMAYMDGAGNTPIVNSSNGVDVSPYYTPNPTTRTSVLLGYKVASENGTIDEIEDNLIKIAFDAGSLMVENSDCYSESTIINTIQKLASIQEYAEKKKIAGRGWDKFRDFVPGMKNMSIKQKLQYGMEDIVAPLKKKVMQNPVNYALGAGAAAGVGGLGLAATMAADKGHPDAAAKLQEISSNLRNTYDMSNYE